VPCDCCYLHKLKSYTVSKKRANFETVYLEIIKIDFDDIWQKYSKYSRIEYVTSDDAV